MKSFLLTFTFMLTASMAKAYTPIEHRFYDGIVFYSWMSSIGRTTPRFISVQMVTGDRAQLPPYEIEVVERQVGDTTLMFTDNPNSPSILPWTTMKGDRVDFERFKSGYVAVFNDADDQPRSYLSGCYTVDQAERDAFVAIFCGKYHNKQGGKQASIELDRITIDGYTYTGCQQLVDVLMDNLWMIHVVDDQRHHLILRQTLDGVDIYDAVPLTPETYTYGKRIAQLVFDTAGTNVRYPYATDLLPPMHCMLRYYDLPMLQRLRDEVAARMQTAATPSMLDTYILKQTACLIRWKKQGSIGLIMEGQ